MRVPQATWRFDETKLVNTDAYYQTRSWLIEASLAPGLWALIGPPGVGKTFGVLAYATEMNIPYLLPLANRRASANKFIRYILAHIKGADPETPYDPFYELIRWATSATQPPQLIIDEAIRLSRDQLDALRDLTDRVPVTIILVGTPELEKKLAHYDTIIHRIQGVFRVPPLTIDDIQRATDCSREVAETLYFKTRGNWRHLHRLLDRIERMGVPPTPQVIDHVASLYILNKED